MFAIPAPRHLCVRTIDEHGCAACAVLTHPDRAAADKTKIDAVDVYRHWELNSYITAALHRRTPWIMVAPFLATKGYLLNNTSLIKGEVEEDDDGCVFQELVDTKALIQPATDRHGRQVFLKSLAFNIPFCPELHVWHKLASHAAMTDPRNHTVPVIEFVTCNPVFPDRPTDPKDLREFVVTPKLTVIKPLENVFFSNFHSAPFLLPDVRSTLEYFYQVSEGIEYMHSCGIAHGDIAERNVLVSDMADGTRRYYIIDFDLSSIHDLSQQRSPKVLASKGLGNAGPEHSLKIPYDPFPNDMYALGMLFDNCVNMSGSMSGERCWNSIPLIKELIESLFAKNPRDRPTARNVRKTIERLQRILPDDILNTHLQDMDPFRDYIHPLDRP